jgi:hypothetical protein
MSKKEAKEPIRSGWVTGSWRLIDGGANVRITLRTTRDDMHRTEQYTLHANTDALSRHIGRRNRAMKPLWGKDNPEDQVKLHQHWVAAQQAAEARSYLSRQRNGYGPVPGHRPPKGSRVRTNRAAVQARQPHVGAS